MRAPGEEPRPPRPPFALLVWLLPPRERDEVVGDLCERYASLAREEGAAAALLWFARQAATLPFHLWGAELRALGPPAGAWRGAAAARRLRRAPGYAVTTVATVALWLAALVGVYGVVDAVLLEPPPYAEPGRLVTIHHRAPGLELPRIPSATGLHVVYGERSRTLEQLALHHHREATLTGAGDPVRLVGAAATPSLLPLLGAAPELGRGFTGDEGRPGAPPVVILSHGLWRERFGGDPAAVGRSATLDGVDREVVGVMGADFAFPDRGTRYWIPLEIDPADRRTFGGFNHEGLARLAPGATPGAARAELQPLLREAAARYDNLDERLLDDGRVEVVVTPFAEARTGGVRRTLLLLLGTAALVFLVACANVATLTLVRAESRRAEVAVRRALGAELRHLVGHFLAEGALLVAAGAAAGLLLAGWALDLLRAAAPEGLPGVEAIGLDGSVLALAAALSTVLALVVALIPLARTPGRHGAGAAAGARGSTSGPGGRRARELLVAGQVALALVLLVGSGLMVRSFFALTAVDPGFETREALVFQLSLPGARYPGPDEIADFHGRFLERIRGLPGVEAAGAASRLPLGGVFYQGPYTARDAPAEPGGGRPFVGTRVVSDGYFEAMGIPVLEGRPFAAADADRPADVAVVSERARRLVLADGDALDRWIAPGVRTSTEGEDWTRVVGVVGDARYRALEEEPDGIVYKPLRVPGYEAWAARTLDYVVRSAVPAATLAPAVRGALAELDPELPLSAVGTLRARLDDARARTRLTTLALLAAAAAGVLLGAVGLYGVLAYATAVRTREIGVRIALGARRGAVRGMVVREGMTVAAAGLGAGLLGAWLLTGFMASLLYGVGARDPWTFGAGTALLAAVATAAAWLPAARASRVDPVRALRGE